MMAYQFKDYEESDAVKQYRQQLEQLLQQKPEEYQSQWQQTQQQAANDVMNRPQFQYNMNTDPLYQQYKQQYQRQGKLAMQDTMGQAAAMNGGYGSSYAQMAGQQAYNSQLQQLNDKVPELYQLALEKYQMEGQAAMDRFNLASSMESQDYSRYQDNLAAWQTERDYATDRYDNERSTDYNMWADMDDREYSRYLDQQQLAMAQVDYLLSIGVQPDAQLLELAGYSDQYVGNRLEQVRAAARAAAAAVSGGGSASGSATDKSGTPSYAEIAKAVNSAASGAAKNVSGALSAITQLTAAGALTQSQANILTNNINNTQNGVNIKSAPTEDELRRMHN
ncbi:MAG: hypothetical protein ACI3XG_02950 [Faecousia sp.]